MAAMEESSSASYLVLALRIIQLLCCAAIITGFVWSSSDLLLTTILKDAPVTPLSVLLMVYGCFGAGLCELVIRGLSKKKESLRSG